MPEDQQSAVEGETGVHAYPTLLLMDKEGKVVEPPREWRYNYDKMRRFIEKGEKGE